MIVVVRAVMIAVALPQRRDKAACAGLGVAGFKNDPFAKLKGDGDKR